MDEVQDYFYLIKDLPDEVFMKNHFLKTGTYILVDLENNQKEIYHINSENQADQTFDLIRMYDYYSQIINTNKCIDKKKLIHSNNYLSFLCKKEALPRITNQIIDGYYEVLEDPARKYGDIDIYQLVVEQLPDIDHKKLHQCKTWVKEWIHDIEIKGKGYLKIFFRDSLQTYQQENLRYLVPNIFLNNQYNQEIAGKLVGVPSGNFNLNAKKPFLLQKTKKIELPILSSIEDALLRRKLQSLFSSFTLQAKQNIFISKSDIISFKNGKLPEKKIKGYFVKVIPGKLENPILEEDTISYTPKLKKNLIYKNYIDSDGENKEYPYGLVIETAEELLHMVDSIYFSGQLINNMFLPEDRITSSSSSLANFIRYFSKIFGDWLYKGLEPRNIKTLHQRTLDLIMDNIAAGYTFRAAQQMNLMYSIEELLQEGDAI